LHVDQLIQSIGSWQNLLTQAGPSSKSADCWRHYPVSEKATSAFSSRLMMKHGHRIAKDCISKNGDCHPIFGSKTLLKIKQWRLISQIKPRR